MTLASRLVPDLRNRGKWIQYTVGCCNECELIVVEIDSVVVVKGGGKWGVGGRRWMRIGCEVGGGGGGRRKSEVRGM